MSKILNIQQFFINGGTPEMLKAQFGINTKIHPKYPNLALFKYSQIDSPMSEAIVQECRGIILNMTDRDFDIVSRPYDKFFNHGEGHAKEIDWHTAKAFEKLDGTCIQMYWYAGDWQVATLGTPDAGGQVSNLSTKTFKDLFWEVFYSLGYKLPEDICFTYIFELMTPYNRVVVRHENPRIVCHGVRDNQFEHEWDITDDAVGGYFNRKYNWEIVKSYPLNNLEAIIEASNKLDPMIGEGYIVCDDKFNRVKVKSPAYCALHHTISNFSSKALLEVIRNNEETEVITYFPEYKSLFDGLKENYNLLITQIQNEYDKYSSIETQKEFALTIKDNQYAGILFALRSGKAKSVKDFLHIMDISKLLTMIERLS